MTSLILRTATRYVMPPMALLSLLLLIRGHDEPGGGFVGGLVLSSALALQALAGGVSSSRRVLRVPPLHLIAAGLLIALGSGMPALLRGEPYMRGLWFERQVWGLGKVALGTPILFDVGVYLVVVGITTAIVWSLTEER